MVTEMLKEKIGVAIDITKEIFETDNRNIITMIEHNFYDISIMFDWYVTALEQLLLLA